MIVLWSLLWQRRDKLNTCNTNHAIIFHETTRGQIASGKYQNEGLHNCSNAITGDSEGGTGRHAYPHRGQGGKVPIEGTL